jgi:hypothetical protein
MENLENKLHEALQKNETSSEIPMPMRDVLVGSLHGQMRKFTLIAYLYIVLFLVLAVAAGIGMFVAKEMVTQILCGIALHGCILIIGFVKLWYWMLTNRNATNRELKRLELQIAELCEMLKKG